LLTSPRRFRSEAIPIATANDAISPDLQSLVAEVVSSYLTKNQVAPTGLPRLITTVYETLDELGKPAEPEPLLTPAVSIRQSVTRDYVVRLDCGCRGNMLRRHIGIRHGLSRDAYRAKWVLAASHALTAPAYSEKRAEVAKQMGLGQRMRSGDDE
jgi:predicted transcriptional regulator